jgi:hypothetical protein
MKNISRLALIAIGTSGLILALASCGGGKSGGASGNSTQSSGLVTAPSSAPQASGNFGSVVTLPSHVTFTLDKLAVFVPTKFSSGQIDGQTYNSFDITVKNASAVPLDLGALILTSVAGTDGACVDIFDGQVGLQGAPSDPVAAGATSIFKWAISCPGKAGDPLTISLTADGVTTVEVKGKLV